MKECFLIILLIFGIKGRLVYGGKLENKIDSVLQNIEFTMGLKCDLHQWSIKTNEKLWYDGQGRYTQFPDNPKINFSPGYNLSPSIGLWYKNKYNINLSYYNDFYGWFVDKQGINTMDSDKTVYYAPYHGAEKEEYSIEYSGRIVGYKLEIGYRIYDWLSIFMNYNHEDNVIGSHPENINMGTARYYQSSKENYNLATRFEKNISNYNIYAKPSLSLKTNLSFFERVLKNDRVRRYEDKIFTGRYYGLLIGISNIIGQRSEVKSKLGYKLEGFYKGYYYNSKSYSRRIGISVGLLYNIDL